ncbi:hypothetical protein K1T71_000198 [Dendrolimus kikuchii]|uniref:Uncharacterized protein n=1 Tax=Dendrolimus kikuchii TaxID=765133 RepID=A0ACC1DIZ9_9NEOP|nr:hypothetical protein K1T71_000198 [Dendrolimus kikuchii]
MLFKITLVVLFASQILTAPADDPVRIDLPVYDKPQADTNVQLSQPFQPENPGGEPLNDQASGGNFINYKLQTASNVLGNKINSQISSFNFGGPFAAPVTTLESAILETEGFGSKTLSINENVQGVVAGLFQPLPIVDTISEEEKYGNNGDKFYSAGQAIVGSAEGLSNVVNSVLEVPGVIFKKISRIATEKLNNLGGKLVGL